MQLPARKLNESGRAQCKVPPAESLAQTVLAGLEMLFKDRREGQPGILNRGLEHREAFNIGSCLAMPKTGYGTAPDSPVISITASSNPSTSLSSLMTDWRDVCAGVCRVRGQQLREARCRASWELQFFDQRLSGRGQRRQLRAGRVIRWSQLVRAMQR